jgi:hypothetical protein
MMLMKTDFADLYYNMKSIFLLMYSLSEEYCFLDCGYM